MTDVVKQRLTSFSTFKRGTIWSKTDTTFPTAISQLSIDITSSPAKVSWYLLFNEDSPLAGQDVDITVNRHHDL